MKVLASRVENLMKIVTVLDNKIVTDFSFPASTPDVTYYKTSKINLPVEGEDLETVVKKVFGQLGFHYVLSLTVGGKAPLRIVAGASQSKAAQKLFDLLKSEGWVPFMIAPNTATIIPARDASEFLASIDVDQGPFTQSFTLRIIPHQRKDDSRIYQALHTKKLSGGGRLFVAPNFLLVSDYRSNIDAVVKILGDPTKISMELLTEEKEIQNEVTPFADQKSEEIVKVQLAKREYDEVVKNIGDQLSMFSGIPGFRDGKAVGIKFLSVKPGSILDKMSFRRGDWIISANGREISVTNFPTLFSLENNRTHYRLLREGQLIEVVVTYR